MERHKTHRKMNGTFLIGSLFMGLLITATADAETSKVILKEAVIRRDCSFFSPSVLRVKFDEQIEIVSKSGDWFKVVVGTTGGCIHKDAVEKKSFSLSRTPGSKEEEPSKDEVALAGKGFTPEIEQSYRNEHPNLEFHAVDEIEEYRISDEALRAFFVTGGLSIPK